MTKEEKEEEEDDDNDEDDYDDGLWIEVCNVIARHGSKCMNEKRLRGREAESFGRLAR